MPCQRGGGLAITIGEFDSDHQAQSPHVVDAGVPLGHAAQPPHDVRPDRADVRQEGRPGDDLEGPGGGRRSQEVAAVRERVELATEPGELPAGEDRRDLGSGTAQPLGRGDDVGPHIEVVRGEHVPGAADTGLDLVEDQDDAPLVADAAQRRQVSVRWHDVAAGAGHRFDDDAGDTPRGRVIDEVVDPFRAQQTAGVRPLPVEAAPAVRVGDMDDPGDEQRERLPAERLPGHRRRQQGLAVVAAKQGDHVTAASVDLCHLHRALVRGGTPRHLQVHPREVRR